MEKSLGGADGSGVCGGGGDKLCSSFNNAVSIQGAIKCEMWEAALNQTLFGKKNKM
jgi:hypothetical protein